METRSRQAGSGKGLTAQGTGDSPAVRDVAMGGTRTHDTLHSRQSTLPAIHVCLTLLASFFLPSHLSFKNMYMILYVSN